MSRSATPTPPLLLTKGLTSFLQANLTPQIHTTLLTTLSGKLLAHASPYPVRTLRTQSTVASSLWALYSSPNTSADAIPEALPPHSAQSIRVSPNTSALTLQLTGAVIVLRRLRCGLLFVSIGPTPEGLGAGEQGSHGRLLHPHQHLTIGGGSSDAGNPTPTVGSPSEVESVVSTGAATTVSVATTAASVTATGVVAMRRQAEELAKWLDSKLGTLGIPVEDTVALDA